MIFGPIRTRLRVKTVSYPRCLVCGEVVKILVESPVTVCDSCDRKMVELMGPRDDNTDHHYWH
jgi:hypothetical protein